ncbi:hypothetical protein M758_8G085200 [Ceratodon purpureus]|nr:hypothetical protein M758_8G085200 [Ceratodon purpureus]
MPSSTRCSSSSTQPLQKTLQIKTPPLPKIPSKLTSPAILLKSKTKHQIEQQSITVAIHPHNTKNELISISISNSANSSSNSSSRCEQSATISIFNVHYGECRSNAPPVTATSGPGRNLKL